MTWMLKLRIPIYRLCSALPNWQMKQPLRLSERFDAAHLFVIRFLQFASTVLVAESTE